MTKKRHKWGPASSDSKYYRHQKCINCKLEKAIKRSRGWGTVNETFYFHSNEKGHITEFGPMQTRVPYGCGERIDAITILEDEWFEI